MSTTIHTQAPAQATAPALRGSPPKTADAPGKPFGDTLAQTIDSAARQAEPAARTGSTAQPTGSQYLHAKTADHDTRHSGKPDTATFMRATGADFSTASSLLYGVVGSNTDYRDWNAIMASGDPVQAARQATGALYNSDLPYTSGNGFKPSAAQTVAASGNFAWLKVNQREGLWVMNNQGEALRQLPASAPDILRAARDLISGWTRPTLPPWPTRWTPKAQHTPAWTCAAWPRAAWARPTTGPATRSPTSKAPAHKTRWRPTCNWRRN